jgi:hypothetical protein
VTAAPTSTPATIAVAPIDGLAPPRPGTATTVETLVSAHHAERRLITELTGIMQRQRNAVATDDLQGVDDSVFAIHRVIVTLGEARRRRQALNRLLGGSDDLEARELADLLGGGVLPPALQEAREMLRASAALLAHEVELNRRVLREALTANDAYVRTMYGGPPAPETISPSAAPSRAGGLLLDRRI